MNPAAADRRGIGTAARQVLDRCLSNLLHPYALFLAVGLLVWWPGGFDIGPFALEDISLFARFSGSRILDPEPARILRDIPVWLGLHLTPHGFQGWQGMMLLLTVLRGVLLYEIVRRLIPAIPLFALVCGLLAIFNPADSGYFLLNTNGVKLCTVLAFASCLAAVVHLHTSSRRSLLAMLTFQLLAGFTYSGFFLLMLALPAGAWLLRWLDGARPSPWFLVKSSALVILGAVFDSWLIHRHVGTDAGMADVNLGRAVGGYRWAIEQTFFAPFGVLQDAAASYAWSVILIALLAGVVAWSLLHVTETDGSREPFRWKHFLAVLLGLIALGLVSYLPYSLTVERIADKRQLFGLGLFAYAAILFIVCSIVAIHVRSRIPLLIIVILVAASVVLTGLEKRTYQLDGYGHLEALLSAVATAAPHPPRDVFILVRLQDETQAADLYSVYRTQKLFDEMLAFLYDDASISGGFVGFRKGLPVAGTQGLTVYPAHPVDSERVRAFYHGGWLAHAPREVPLRSIVVPYDQLLVVDYPRGGQPRLLDGASLYADKLVPSPQSYVLPDVGTVPAEGSNICSMLELRYRPAYCTDH